MNFQNSQLFTRPGRFMKLDSYCNAGIIKSANLETDGLARHNTIIKKYNQSSKIVRIPKKVLKEFKQTLVFLIHQKLSNNFNHMGHQSFHVLCSKSLFFEIFRGHIHYSKANGRKFYKQNQQTYIVIREEFQSLNKSNTLMVEKSEMDIDLLLQLVVKKSQKQHRKPKFTYSEVLVE
ncbi:16258_t:CDS:2 [Cetraspora pellucida]|uniref:16258_t:CDS:1 n=1 Tax=Cetraspora pellucida TaxID=1433469 RepID=A0A9N8ZRM4_9GLOM|nr:16258_t:CDS:2 [Cetraspora pellucida]